VVSCPIDQTQQRRQREIIEVRHVLLRAARTFFYERGYLEVETPNLMATAPPDPHIDPLAVSTGAGATCYLHTSPEIQMKRLLPIADRIFQICKVYRAEEFAEVHNTEFTMLEWYRKGTYLDLMGEVEELVRWVAESIPGGVEGISPQAIPVYDLEQICLELTGISPFPPDRADFLGRLKDRGFPGVDDEDSWNDLFFKLFIQEVEPVLLARGGPYFIKDWPKAISTMAKLKDQWRVERFELYINGLEIANGYTELVDPVEQGERFRRDNEERTRMGKEAFIIDDQLLGALGCLEGSYAGVSVGIDRLLMALLGKKRIEDVLVHRVVPPAGKNRA
jgi:elongation factor P--(R)-beta-lysine ligase